MFMTDKAWSFTVQWCGWITILVAVESHTGGLYDMTCCAYCRSEPPRWVSLGHSFSLSESTLSEPAAFLVDDIEEQAVAKDTQTGGLTIRYAGAPLKLEFNLDSDVTGLIDNQYYQMDLAEPKYIGGVLSQGGFYEETRVGFYPYTESWVTRYVVSTSNSSDQDFQLMTGDTGNVQIFQGNTDSRGIQINNVGAVARYIRVHPLQAESPLGGISSVNLRVSAIVCSRAPCLDVRINCLLSEWSAWSECLCSGLAGCESERTRTVRRIQTCGGERCGELQQSVPCTPPEPAWKSVVQYLGIAVAVVLVLGLIWLIIYKKKHKNKVEVIVVTEHQPGEEEDGPVVLPRGEKSREAKASNRGFEDPCGWDMDPLHGARYMEPPTRETFPRQLPRPPAFN